MYWTLELASKLEDAPWPATKEELIDYAIRSGAPLRYWRICRRSRMRVISMSQSRTSGPTTLLRMISSLTRRSINLIQKDLSKSSPFLFIFFRPEHTSAGTGFGAVPHIVKVRV